ncbi:MAG: hypothetical protein H7343_07645 [Undibacterium sp.]|nr:hypothetical protein [Opitutaceae bacterium]
MIESNVRTSRSRSRLAVFITAIIVFSFLMAVREEFHSIWVRAGVAGLAAAILAAGIYQMGARKKEN